MMLVGEQPGDREDIEGRPFVGPAGGVLERALAEAGIERDSVYVTNAVKHFKWEARGKRRIHKRPNAAEIDAYLERRGSRDPDLWLIELDVGEAERFAAETTRQG